MCDGNGECFRPGEQRDELLTALKTCSFAFAKLVAASGSFTDEYAAALDAASAAIAKAEAIHV